MIFEKSAVAVVSGGASGLGAATARKLTSMGACVAIFDRNVAAGEAWLKSWVEFSTVWMWRIP